jgi:hypothetical protein
VTSDYSSLVSLLGYLDRRAEAALRRAGGDLDAIIVINEGRPAFPGAPRVVTFTDRHGRRTTVMSEIGEALDAFLDRVCPPQIAAGRTLWCVGGLPPEPRDDAC